ncbi:hypothetical protein BJX76DRAFT_355000 [Aspergillus varians]
MHFLKPLLISWACLAQISLAGVAFTKWPSTVYTGKPATLYWKADSDAPAVITLRQGPSGNLRNLKVLTTQAGGGSFTWVPEESLPAGTDYALQIEQDGNINYSGLITLTRRPGQEASPPSTSKNTPLPSDSTPPLGGAMPGIQKGNNGYVPALNSSTARIDTTSDRSTSSKSNDGTTFRHISTEMTLAALAAIIYFAA